MINLRSLVTGILLFTGITCSAQLQTDKQLFTHADTVRGSITPERAWWTCL
jgi:hypothetical protein